MIAIRLLKLELKYSQKKLKLYKNYIDSWLINELKLELNIKKTEMN